MFAVRFWNSDLFTIGSGGQGCKARDLPMMDVPGVVPRRLPAAIDTMIHSMIAVMARSWPQQQQTLVKPSYVPLHLLGIPTPARPNGWLVLSAAWCSVPEELDRPW